MTLTEFLLKRVEEDEVEARRAVIPAHDGYKPHPELARWRYVPDGEVEYDYDDPGPYPETYHVTCDGEGILPAVGDTVGPHIARWDPARVLAECEAKRKMLDPHLPDRAHDDPWAHTVDPACTVYETYDHTIVYEDECPVMRLLALPYSDHPDYRKEWRP